MAIRYLDGRRLQRSFIAGANAVNAHRDQLNAINVFPVPDADTGTNMAATLTYAADGIAHLDDPSLDEVRHALGRAVLVGARGNSGFIISQFLRGFLEGIGEGVRRVHRSELARASQRGTQRAYEALMEPVEGTILTVMKEWSRAVTSLSRDLKDIQAIANRELNSFSFLVITSVSLYPVILGNCLFPKRIITMFACIIRNSVIVLYPRHRGARNSHCENKSRGPWVTGAPLSIRRYAA